MRPCGSRGLFLAPANEGGRLRTEADMVVFPLALCSVSCFPTALLAEALECNTTVCAKLCLMPRVQLRCESLEHSFKNLNVRTRCFCASLYAAWQRTIQTIMVL
jgi:hypothetical protein